MRGFLKWQNYYLDYSWHTVLLLALVSAFVSKSALSYEVINFPILKQSFSCQSAKSSVLNSSENLINNLNYWGCVDIKTKLFCSKPSQVILGEGCGFIGVEIRASVNPANPASCAFGSSFSYENFYGDVFNQFKQGMSYGLPAGSFVSSEGFYDLITKPCALLSSEPACFPGESLYQAAGGLYCRGDSASVYHVGNTLPNDALNESYQCANACGGSANVYTSVYGKRFIGAYFDGSYSMPSSCTCKAGIISKCNTVDGSGCATEVGQDNILSALTGLSGSIQSTIPKITTFKDSTAYFSLLLDKIKLSSNSINASKSDLTNDVINSNLSGINSRLDSINAKISDSVTIPASSGFPDNSQDVLSDSQDLKNQITTVFNSIKTSLPSAFNFSVPTGLAKLPCPNDLICLSDFDSQLSLLPSIVYGLSLLIAGFIVISKRDDDDA